MKFNLNNYKKYLEDKDLSASTKENYMYTVSYFKKHYKEITKENLKKYRDYLMENFNPRTVNLRLSGIDSLLKSLKLFEEYHLAHLKIQQKPFLENVISEADYEFLKNALLQEKDLENYFIIRYLGATGARASEFVQLKVEHVKKGYFDIYGKGTKFRRIYIPNCLKEETLKWLKNIDRKNGYLFCDLKTKDNTKPINKRSLDLRLKQIAKRYNIDNSVMHAHSFRHRFAKNFIDKYKDICFLADLMGHESIDTTRIYVRKTATEQQEIVNEVVTW